MTAFEDHAPAPPRPSSRKRGYDTDWDKLRARCVREETHCAICGKPVDKSLSGRDRLGPSVDHIVPLARGGTNTRDNVQLTHLGCNSSKRAGALPKRQREPERHPGVLGGDPL